MKMETGNLIRTGDFCKVVTDKLASQGVKRGHMIYVAGYKALPVDRADPYMQRINFLCNLYNHKTYEMGKELYLIDPVSIERVSDKERDEYLTEYKVANGID
jgi:hypothetical protein